jgi:hypothetical protein
MAVGIHGGLEDSVAAAAARLGAAVLHASCALLSEPLYVSANGVFACLLGGGCVACCTHCMYAHFIAACLLYSSTATCGYCSASVDFGAAAAALDESMHSAVRHGSKQRPSWHGDA